MQGYAAHVLTLFALAMLCSSSAGAQEPFEGPLVPLGEGAGLRFFPAANLHDRYVADPRQSFMKLAYLRMLETDTTDIGQNFFSVSLGGRVRLAQIHPAGHPELGVVFSIEAGFIGIFDLDAQYDGVGWNGYYAFRLGGAFSEQISWKLAIQHDSGHIADEYIAKTGRERVIYTREEVALAVAYEPVPFLRAYADGGWAYHLNRDMEPWRFQGGLEVHNDHLFAAMDSTFWQELDWAATGTWMAGVKWSVEPTSRHYRLAVQYESGRSVLSEFYLENNRTLSFGLWADM